MKIKVNTIPNYIPMKNMKHNQFAVIVEGGYKGTIVFRVPDSWTGVHSNDFIAFGVHDDDNIDGFSSNCPILVRVLEKGESFTLTI